MKPQHILAVDAASECLSRYYNGNEEEARVLPLLDFCNSSLFILQRERAERDWAYRHIIPYTVVMNGQGKVLVYQRGKGVGEQRLAGQCSIGWGGHIDLNDVRYEDSVIDLGRTINSAGERELEEELGIQPEYLEICDKGIILDDSNSVGRVHVGLLQLAIKKGGAKAPKCQEEELVLLGWKDLDEIDPLTLEPWSQAALRWLKTGVYDSEREANADLAEAEEMIDATEWMVPAEDVQTIDLDEVLDDKPGFFQRFRVWLGFA